MQGEDDGYASPPPSGNVLIFRIHVFGTFRCEIAMKKKSNMKKVVIFLGEE